LSSEGWPCASSTAEQLRAWLDRIDAGTPSDGDPGHVAELAIRSIEEVDHQVPASLGDFLATPGMAGEFERITAALR
jgi:hypothetical protein